MGPSEDLRPHVVGDAEKSGDDHDGDRFGKGRDEIGGSLHGELVDQLVRQPLHFRTESLDLAREERGVDEPAQAGVNGGFDFEQGVFFESVERREVRGYFGPAEFRAGGKVEDLASEAAVAEEGTDLVIASKTPVTEFLPVEDGAFGAELGVKRIRVLDKIRITRVEGD